MKRKLLKLTLMAINILLLVTVIMLLTKKKENYIQKPECVTDSDCPVLYCFDCGYLCEYEACIFVNCGKHGSFSQKERGCYCADGWTGRYCDEKIEEK